MAKENSWSVPRVSNIIGRKQVDWSMFEWGTTIPLEYHSAFRQLKDGKTDLSIIKGRIPIKLIHDEITYDAILQMTQIKDRGHITYQIRYDSNHALKTKLSKTFQLSYKYIVAERKRQFLLGKKRPPVIVPAERSEFIDFLATESPYEYFMIFHPFMEEDEEQYQN